MLWKFLPACFPLAPHTCQFGHLFSLENTILNTMTVDQVYFSSYILVLLTEKFLYCAKITDEEKEMKS